MDQKPFSRKAVNEEAIAIEEVFENIEALDMMIGGNRYPWLARQGIEFNTNLLHSAVLHCCSPSE